MRPLVIAVLLLSCAESRPAPEPRRTEARPVPEPRRTEARPVPEPRRTEARPAPEPRRTEALVAVVADHKPAAPQDSSLAATRQAAHDILAEHCGACHEGHRSTNARALAVYDLDQPDWPSRFDAHRFEAALRRLASKPEPARAAFIAFRDAELAASPARPD